MTLKKSFATAFFAAMVVFALAFLASVLLVQDSGFQNAQLESRIAGARFEDARDLVNWTQEDAIFDAAYAFACNSQVFCDTYPTLVNSYWSNVRGELNDSIVNVSFSGTVASCGWFQVLPDTFSFNVGFTGVMEVTSKNTFKNASFAFAKTGTVQTRSSPRGATARVFETGTTFSYDCPAGFGGGLEVG
ncbi:MAG: hypothetical protein QXR53_00200 [Candidatus Norongarragalinales archaeon]